MQQNEKIKAALLAILSLSTLLNPLMFQEETKFYRSCSIINITVQEKQSHIMKQCVLKVLEQRSCKVLWTKPQEQSISWILQELASHQHL
jgi:hypothetical protein